MSDPTINDLTVYEDNASGFGIGLFYNVIPANQNSVYSFRAYAIDEDGNVYYGDTIEVTTIVLDHIVVTPVLPVILIGNTVQFQVIGYYTDGTILDVTNICSYLEIDYALFEPVPEVAGQFTVVMTSGSGVVASVNNTGLTTGLSGGLAKIKISIDNIIQYALVAVQPEGGTVDIGGGWDGGVAPGTVVPDIISLGLIITSPMLVGGSQQAQVVAYYDDGSQSILNPLSVTWLSSNVLVATIDSSGLIVGIAAGLSFIRASYEVYSSPDTIFTTLLMLKVEALGDNIVAGQLIPYQYIPLQPAPNQSFRSTLAASAVKSIDLNFNLSWNGQAGYWVMTLSNPATGDYYVDSIPLFAGISPTMNLLKQYSYLDIGSCYIINISGKGLEVPDDTNLGIDFIMLWGYTE